MAPVRTIDLMRSSDVSTPTPLLAVLLLALAQLGRSAVTQVQLEPVPVQDRDEGMAANYEMLRGRVYGELNPNDSQNAIIQDIQLAPRNARGRVEYVTTFTLYQPVAGARRSGVLIYEVVNRGSSIAPRDYATGDF